MSLFINILLMMVKKMQIKNFVKFLLEYRYSMIVMSLKL